MAKVLYEDVSCLQTVVKNISGRTLTFSFLPPHGVTLNNGDTYAVEGDLPDAIRNMGRGKAERNLVAMQHAIEDQVLTIVSAPNPILQDTSSGATKMITLTGGALVVAIPCFQHLVSIDPTLPEE